MGSWPSGKSHSVKVILRDRALVRAPTRSVVRRKALSLADLLAAWGSGRCVLCRAPNAKGEVGVGPIYVKVCDDCAGSMQEMMRGIQAATGMLNRVKR